MPPFRITIQRGAYQTVEAVETLPHVGSTSRDVNPRRRPKTQHRPTLVPQLEEDAARLPHRIHCPPRSVARSAIPPTAHCHGLPLPIRCSTLSPQPVVLLRSPLPGYAAAGTCPASSPTIRAPLKTPAELSHSTHTREPTAPLPHGSGAAAPIPPFDRSCPQFNTDALHKNRRMALTDAKEINSFKPTPRFRRVASSVLCFHAVTGRIGISPWAFASATTRSRRWRTSSTVIV
jgi:hypothetical protein